MYTQTLAALALCLLLVSHAHDLENGIKVMKVTEMERQQETRVYGKGMVAMDTEVKGHVGKMRQLSDGKQLLRMIFDGQEELVDCMMEIEPPRVEAFMKHVLGQEYESVHQEIHLKRLADQVYSEDSKNRVEILKELNLEEIQQFSEMLEMASHMSRCSELQRSRRHGTSLRRSPRSFFIFPGTNWCGDGSNAEALGEAIDTDKCCRQHDNCPYFIESMTEKYNYFNFGLYTISHCACDEQFRTCLRIAGSESSSNVGNVFFNWLGMSCFVFERTQVCAERAWYGRCLRYEHQYEAVKRDPLSF